MSNAKAKAGARDRSGPTAPQILAKAAGDGFLRLIDRGDLGTALCVVLLVCITLIVGLVFLRMPATELSPFLRAAGRFLANGVLPFSLLVNGFLTVLIWLQRKIYKAEIRRIGDAKTRLLKQVDPTLESSGHDIGGE